MRTSVLVTGGAGYVGSHVCKLLARDGYRPVTYDDLSHGHRSSVKWGPLIEGSILDPARLESAMRESQATAVLHFAGKILVGESVADPRSYFQSNVTGFQNVLDSARNTGIKTIVFSSSCAVYGVPQYLPLDEKHPCLPVQPYGVTKRVAEQLLEAYCHAYGMHGIALRYFNASGADPDGDIGELHHPETHLIPNVLNAAIQRLPLTVFGSDYETQDGTCVRDYVHVTDLAEAHVLALTRSHGFEAFNLCSERGISNLELIQAAERMVGVKVEIKRAPRRPGDVPVLLGNSKFAESVLKWRRTHSDLESILASAISWYKKGNSAHAP